MITTALFTLQGRTVELTRDASTGEYVGTFVAPDKTSWFEPSHVYIGAGYAADADGNTDTAETTLRVLSDRPPQIKLAEPVEQWLFPSRDVTLAWSVSSETGAVGTGLTIDGAAVAADIAGTDFQYRARYAAETPDGEHAAVITVTDNDGNTAALTTEFADYAFIIDRTPEDVEAVREAARRVSAGTITRAAFLAMTRKGAYNASDMNRVATAVFWLSRLYARYGYGKGIINTKRDWKGGQDFGTPTPAQLQTYVDNVRTLKDYVPEIIIGLTEYTMPALPANAVALTTGEANSIEIFLLLAIELLKIIAANTRTYDSAEISAGEV